MPKLKTQVTHDKPLLGEPEKPFQMHKTRDLPLMVSDTTKKMKACAAFACGGTTFEAGVHVPKFWEFLLQ